MVAAICIFLLVAMTIARLASRIGLSQIHWLRVRRFAAFWLSALGQRAYWSVFWFCDRALAGRNSFKIELPPFLGVASSANDISSNSIT